MATEHVQRAFNIIPQKQRTEDPKTFMTTNQTRMSEAKTYLNRSEKNIPAAQEAKSTCAQMR
jgi:hypothetical protein